jgi:hypothetical protein
MRDKTIQIRRYTKPRLSSVIALAVTSAQAQEADALPLPKNRVSLSYRAGFNVRASFRGLGGVPPASNPGPGPAGGSDQQHTYDDGYVRPDSTAGDGMTWNWGYRSDTQTPGDGKTTIEFHSSQSQNGGELSDISSDPNHGFELNYERWLGRVGSSGNWGFLFGFNYGNVSVRTDRSFSTTAIRTTDVYNLGGAEPPDPPYDGSFEGPGTLIDDPALSRNVASATSVLTGRHELDADVFGFHLGPYLEFPITQKLSFNSSAGLALAVVDSKFSFTESATVAGLPSGFASGSNSKSDLLYGGYVSANLAYALNRQWSLVAGVEYQYLSDFKQTLNGREAKLDFSTGIYAKAGVSFSF